MFTLTIEGFEDWRTTARRLLAGNCPPHECQLLEDDGQTGMFDGSDLLEELPSDQRKTFSVPKQFVALSQEAAYHRAPDRWHLLYRVLWRLTHDEPHLLEIVTDDDVARLMQMEKQVRRDAHKMKAFVRFREVQRENVSHFIAWHRPDHRIVRKVAPFFSRRFRGMNWTILTPDESVAWDGSTLHYGPGAPRSAAPGEDELEKLWKTYYGNIFNPARIKVEMMKSEMPVRHWPTLPETELIPQLLEDAPARVAEMIRRSEGYQTTAAQLIQSQAAPPADLATLAELQTACTACDLFKYATQVVPGDGPATARLVLVGEQPGDQEDLAGRPFTGPAGRELDAALRAAGIARESVYATNVVKHFKHETVQTPRGKKRLHRRPGAREIRCCKPWFDAEWSLLPQASVLVCLGATAAQSLIGPGFRLTEKRGQTLPSDYCPQTIATWHPSAILRASGDVAASRKRKELTADLAAAWRLLK